MIRNELETRTEQVLSVARAMMAAARTAPKGRGVDNIEVVTISGGDLDALAAQMRDHAERSGMAFFVRDAGNVEQSEAVVLIGTHIEAMGLNCGFCGFPTCAEKNKYEGVPCTFNSNDMGIAIGSAAAIAADNSIDSRVMYSIGKAALELGWLPQCGAAFGIVLSCTSKSPFFDRPVAQK